MSWAGTSISAQELDGTSDGELYTFTFWDGTIVNYYLDEEGFPYDYVDGERCYMMLPLPHLEITDEALLAICQKDLPEDPTVLDNLPQTRSAPTNYVDLSGSTSSYTERKVTLPGDAIYYTPIFKWNTSHSSCVFTTSDMKYTDGPKIGLAYNYYVPTEDRWHSSLIRSGVDCRAGFRFNNFPSAQPYAELFFNKYDNVISFDYTVTSSSAW